MQTLAVSCSTFLCSDPKSRRFKVPLFLEACSSWIVTSWWRSLLLSSCISHNTTEHIDNSVIATNDASKIRAQLGREMLRLDTFSFSIVLLVVKKISVCCDAYLGISLPFLRNVFYHVISWCTGAGLFISVFNVEIGANNLHQLFNVRQKRLNFFSFEEQT